MKIDLQYKNLHINKEFNILHIAICCILLFYSLDCIYFVFRFSLGYGFPASEYGDPNDIFGDLFQGAFAIKGIFNDFFKSEAFSQLDEIYKMFAVHSGYKSMAEWTSGYHSINWLLPAGFIIPALAALLLKNGISPQLIVILYISILFIVTLYGIYYCCRLGKIKFPIILSFLLVGVALPTIHAILRGNFNAAFTCTGIIIFCIAASLEN
jgi:hypothetical protein